MISDKEQILRKIIDNQKQEIVNLKQEKLESQMIRFYEKKQEVVYVAKNNNLMISIFINVLLVLFIIVGAK